MVDENLKVIDKLAKRGLITAEQAAEARKLQGSCALIYLSVLTQQINMVREQLQAGIAAINAKAEAAKHTHIVSTKGDAKP
jgi:hypothetical protein